MRDTCIAGATCICSTAILLSHATRRSVVSDMDFWSFQRDNPDVVEKENWYANLQQGEGISAEEGLVGSASPGCVYFLSGEETRGMIAERSSPLMFTRKCPTHHPTICPDCSAEV